MKKSEIKTNAIRLLEQKKIPFTIHNYTDSGAVSGMEVAAVLGENPEAVFKTLVTVGKSGEHYVFVVPVNRELSLKKAALCFCSAGEQGVKPEESGERGGREECQHDKIKGAAAAYWLYPRGLLPDWDEEVFQDVY